MGKHKNRKKNKNKNQNETKQTVLTWTDCAFYLLLGGEVGAGFIGMCNLMYIADQLAKHVVYSDLEIKLYGFGGFVAGAVAGGLAGYGLFKNAQYTEQMEKVEEAKHFDPNSIKIFSYFIVPDSNDESSTACIYHRK